MYRKNGLLTNADLQYANDPDLYFNLDEIIQAITDTNNDLVKQYTESKTKYRAPILNYVMTKNLSGAIGECFGDVLSQNTGLTKKNPHESGYPDFLPVSPRSDNWFQQPTKDMFPYGGFETKASYTKNFTRVTATSHHQQTNHVLCVQWHYSPVDIPEIIGVYYTNRLTVDDWSPMKLGSPTMKTTPASSLTASGKDKLRRGWLVLNANVILPTKKSIKLEYQL